MKVRNYDVSPPDVHVDRSPSNLRGQSSATSSFSRYLHGGPSRFVSLLCIVISSSLLVSGCEVPGVILHTLVGELPVPAQYVPPKVTTLVLVENYRSPDEMRIDGDQIAHEISDELKKATKIPLLDPDKLAPLREEDPDKFRTMSCQAIGRTLGAKQIIYVDLLESAVTGDVTQSVVHAHALAEVRVVDVDSGKTLWPTTAARGTELEAKADYDLNDNSHALTMRTQMLSSLSSRIAKLFHSWKPDSEQESDAGG